MIKEVEIRVAPEHKENTDIHIRKVAQSLQLPPEAIYRMQVVRRSIDARGKKIVYALRIQVSLAKEIFLPSQPSPVYTHQSREDKTVIIVGAGPTGYFAALRCIELGMRPIVLDRGKDVQARRRDLRQIQQLDTVNPDSNYCYGEGGAGTYSDGKLYTRANKRGNVKKILRILADHGAHGDILIDAHPHIGSNKLPKIISHIRLTIEKNGGEVLFGQKVSDFIIRDGKMLGVRTATGQEYLAPATILCTGHSARDIYLLCHKSDIDISFKPFAIGARMEHPQELINQIQYKTSKRSEHLPAATYGLNCQVGGHGVFSFCMCPGGLIVPAATSPGELVVNGMSLSRRDSPFANAATVVTLDQNPNPSSPLGGMDYQESLEQHIFGAGNGSQAAPAQRLTDFVSGHLSSDLPDSSYIPGTYSAPLHDLLPSWIVESIRAAMKTFDRKMKGYYTSEAQLVGLESRTSAPIRIERDPTTLMSTSTDGLFPGGEGAGYAGGILSAALDGERVANAVDTFLKN